MKQALKQYALRTSCKARQRRAELFKRLFAPTEADRILDLGGGDGSHMTLLGVTTSCCREPFCAKSLYFMEPPSEMPNFETVSD